MLESFGLRRGVGDVQDTPCVRVRDERGSTDNCLAIQNLTDFVRDG